LSTGHKTNLVANIETLFLSLAWPNTALVPLAILLSSRWLQILRRFYIFSSLWVSRCVRCQEVLSHTPVIFIIIHPKPWYNAARAQPLALWLWIYGAHIGGISSQTDRQLHCISSTHNSLFWLNSVNTALVVCFYSHAECRFLYNDVHYSNVIVNSIWSCSALNLKSLLLNYETLNFVFLMRNYLIFKLLIF